MLQQHLSLAVQVGNQVGADSTTVVAGPNPNTPDRGDRRNRNVREDAEFMRDVSADNTMMMQLGELAQNRARNEDVRNFARRVREDHSRLQEQWESMANKNGFPLKEGMGRRHREKVELLRDARGNNFDRTFMTLMVQQHSDEVSYWRKEGRASHSQPVRNLVDRGLPTLEQHFEQARQIARQIGVDPDRALRNRKDIARDRGRDRNND
jgi:putative membrane protein